MKKITTILKRVLPSMLFILGICSTVQVSAQCDNPVATTEMEVNNFIVQLLTGQDLFTTGSGAGYEIPAGSGVHPLFAIDFWMGGVTDDGELKFAGGRYRGDETDYYTGPLTLGTAEVDESTCGSYDQFSICYLIDSQLHLMYYDAVSAGTEDVEFPDGYTAPSYFYTYPAMGSGDQAEFLAPFFDYNADFSYDPDDGDCPLFASMIPPGSGQCDHCGSLNGDVAVFWIDNDMGGEHAATGGAPIGVEIHNVWFAYYAEEGLISNTSFLQKKIINRGTQTIQDFGVTLFADVDLGSGGDDLIGCIPSENLGFVYNGDNNDEASSSSNGYGIDPPVFGIAMLDGIENNLTEEDLGMTSFMNFNNSNNPQTGDPQSASEYYNYMKGLWKDGTQPTCYDQGNTPGSTPTNFLYNHDVDGEDCSWTENDSANESGDRTFIMSSQGTTLTPGAEDCVTFAFIYQENTSGSIEETIDDLGFSSEGLKDLYTECLDGLASIEESIAFVGLEADILFDQENQMLTVDSKKQLSLSIFNSVGQLVQSEKIQNQNAIPLGDLSSGMYIIHLQDENQLAKTKKIIIE